MMSANENELLRDVRAAIEGLPGVVVRSVQHGDGISTGTSTGIRENRLDLQVEVQGHPARILIESKAQGYPRDIRDAAWRLTQNQPARGEDDPASSAPSERAVPAVPLVLMVVAPAISPKGRELLRKDGFAYWDRGGSIYIELPWALFFVDRPQPRGAERQIGNIYRGRTTQVLHAMLLEPGRHWQVQELARRAEVSPYTVHQVLTSLEKQLWVEKQGAGPNTVRILRDPGALLDAWANAHSLTQYKFYRFHSWSQTRSELRQRVTGVLDELGMEYALTLASGAELVAPFATGVERLTLLVQDTAQIEEAAMKMKLTPVESGENIAFLATRDRSPLMFRQQIEDAYVASNVQLYLDLRAWPKRGKEQAEHLRSARLSY